jgi:hypothetical protein
MSEHTGGTTEPEPAESAELLGELAGLRRRTRRARHAYWFPLILFGLLTCASVPFYSQPPVPAAGSRQSGVTIYPPGGPPMRLLGGGSPLVSGYLGYYWLAGLAAGLLLTLLWYRRNARRVGLATPARGYVITSAVLTALAFFLPPLSAMPALHWLGLLWPGDLVIRGTFPFVVIAIGLWVLAWAERSLALVTVAALYTAAALLTSLYNVENILFRLGWNPSGDQLRLTGLPNVLLPALVLLVAGAAAFAVQRRNRAVSP